MFISHTESCSRSQWTRETQLKSVFPETCRRFCRQAVPTFFIFFLLKQPLACESKFAQSWNINYTVLPSRECEALIFSQPIKMLSGLDWKRELLATLKKGSSFNLTRSCWPEDLGLLCCDTLLFHVHFSSLSPLGATHEYINTHLLNIQKLNHQPFSIPTYSEQRHAGWSVYWMKGAGYPPHRSPICHTKTHNHTHAHIHNYHCVHLQ